MTIIRVAAAFVVAFATACLATAPAPTAATASQPHGLQHRSASERPFRRYDADRTEGAWLGANGDALKVLNPMINTLLTQALANFTYANVSGADGSIIYNISNIVVDRFLCDNCVTLALGNGHATLAATNVSLKLDMDYAAHWHFFHTSGHCSPDVTGMSFSAQVGFGAPVKGKPTVTVSGLQLSVGTLSLGCTGMAGRFIDALTYVATGIVTKIASRVLSYKLPALINAKLQTINLAMNVSDDFATVDFNLVPSTSCFTATGVHVGVAGVIVPEADPNIVFPFPAPAKLRDSCSRGMVSIGLSTYSFETAMYTYRHRLAATFANAIKAGDLALLVPGFALALGRDALLNVSFAATGRGKVTSSPSQQSLTAALPMNITIAGAQGTRFVLGVLATVGVHVNVSAGPKPAVHFGITSLALSGPTVRYTNVGGGTLLALLVDLLNHFIRKDVLPALDDFFGKYGIPLPSLHGFSLAGTRVGYIQQSICVAASLSYAGEN